MTQRQLLEMLDFFDSKRIWAFRLNAIRMYFNNEDEKSIQIALNRHTKNGIITQCARGVYANPRGKKPLFVREYLALMLREQFTFYLSLESVLSEEGLISQIPNRLTFVSKDRSRVFNTPYGILEFVHSEKKDDFLKDCYYDNKRLIWVASKEKAIKDLYRHRRSVDLYEEQLEKDRLWI